MTRVTVDDTFAEKMAAIFATADHGCSVCAQRLALEAQRVWPQFDWEILVKEALDRGY